MKTFTKIKKCRICKSSKLLGVIDLHKQYIQGSFLKKKNPKPFMKRIPLQLVLCVNCSLVQLRHTTNKNILYKNYWYESGINLTMRMHLKNLVKDISKFANKKKVNVLDIGCNDGTLLNFYDKRFKKYGIDPSQIVKKIDKKKISIINDFYPPKKKVNKINNTKFQLITSIAMFYDLDDPNLFVKQIKKNLDINGVWVFELSYLIDMLKLRSFDTICHEHLEYYSLTSLEYLMNKNELKIFKVSKNTINGGSIRCYVTHKNNYYRDNDKDRYLYNKYLKIEKILKIKNVQIYKKFNKEINNIKKKIYLKIKKILDNKQTIFILGASTKGNTILQFLGINNQMIPYAIERNKSKIGAITIGSNIKIISELDSENYKIDYKLVLPWHFKKEIIKREKKYIINNGSLIFPLPKLQIINKKNYKHHE
ncbi:class I SAM-dependent methyltransferase [Candidatus Pelagibacter sp.]|uniref:class I SAM-dependent methyltransferase n=1 Tax=Candidatus Pelagibacter sp. TaxID=2024849 RepID=UPI003F82D494